MAQRVELAEMIEQVADQLREVQSQTPPGAEVMQFTEAEIELTASVEKDAKLGVRIYVVELGGGAKKAGGTRVTVRFSSLPANPIAALTIQGPTPAPVDAEQYSKRTPAPTQPKQAGSAHDEDGDADDDS